MRSLLLAALAPLTVLAQHWPAILTAEDGPEHSVILHLRNEYTSPLTAYRIGHREGDARHWNSQVQWTDSTTSPAPEEGTLPGAAADITVKNSSVPAAEWKLQGVLFADGIVAGEAEAIQAILDTRAATAQDLAKAIALLTTATPDPADLTAALHAWRKETLPVTRPGEQSSMPVVHVVPQRVLSLLDQGQSLPEIVQLLTAWRDRLAAAKPAIPTTPHP